MSFVTRLSLHETLTLIGLLIRGFPEVSSRNIGCKVQDRERERESEREDGRCQYTFKTMSMEAALSIHTLYIIILSAVIPGLYRNR